MKLLKKSSYKADNKKINKTKKKESNSNFTLCEKWLLRVDVFIWEDKIIIILSNNDNSDISYKYKNQ